MTGHKPAIVIMFFLFAMISFVTGLQSPMGVIVKNQFEVSNFISQLGNAANFIAYLFMGLPAGMLLKRYGYKITSQAAVSVGFIGVSILYLSGQMGSFGIYLTGAFVSGFSMCLLNTVVNPMLNTLGGGGKTGNQLIQFGGSLNSLSATIIPVFIGYLMGDVARANIEDANPALYIAMAIFALALIVISFSSIPEPGMEKQPKAVKTNLKSKHSPLSFRHFVLGAIAIMIYVGIEVGVPGVANLFMTSPELNIPASEAGSVISTFWFLMLVGRLTGGIVGAHFSSRQMLVGVSSLGLILVLSAIYLPITMQISMPVFKANISFGLASVPVSIMLLMMTGLCCSIMWGAIFNLAIEGLGKYTELGSGIFMMIIFGGGLMPLLQAYIADISSYINSYWVIVISLAYILYYALYGSKNVNKDIQTS